MSTLLLTAPGGHELGVVARRARLRERLAARWRAGSIERRLARGAAPESDAALALRAQALVGTCFRRALAREVQRVVVDARGRHAWLARQVPTRRREILAVADELEAVVERLRGPEPVSARGVAQVRVLLTDGSGPLYYHGATSTLRSAVARALEALDE